MILGIYLVIHFICFIALITACVKYDNYKVWTLGELILVLTLAPILLLIYILTHVEFRFGEE